MIFNVIVSDSLATGGTLPTPRAEVERVLRPEGGVAAFGLKDDEIVRRGPLPGAGEWTHLYGDAGNSACSHDQLVKGELQIQWFGPPGARPMIDRHHRTTSPLYKNGRLFVPGEDRVIGVDAYNGTILWDRAIPQSRRVSVFRDNGFLALADDTLYVAAGDQCLALDPDSGKNRHIFALPAESGKYEWGYVATQGELLLGSAVKAGSIRREQSHKATVTTTHWDFVPAVASDLVFARRRQDGKLLWTYRPPSGLIVNPTLAAASGALYFVESDNPETQKPAIAQLKLAELVGKGSSLVALDIQSGQVLWKQPGVPFAGVQHNLFLSWAEGALIVVCSRNSGPNKKTDRLWYDIHVFDSKTGKLRWSKSQNQEVEINGEHGEQERHPVIVNGTLYCEPYAYDLATGTQVEWNWPWNRKQRRGCGTLSASASCFFFRDENVAAFDLNTKEVKKLTSETRPGCWINLLPAGGLLLAPEASSGCSCDHPVQTSLALRPKK
jgi:outer membrane protein assembly factor BamB